MSAVTVPTDVLDLDVLGRHAGISPGAAEFVVAFADDEHMIGARHAEWIGLGPFLEEDLAFCSIAQDECGHALRLYELVTDAPDRLALRRSPDHYRSSHLAEVATDDWADALVRHWLYDRAETLRWDALRSSSMESLAELAERAIREERFHFAHADRFMAHIARGGEQAVERVSAAIERILPFAVQAWTPVAGEPAAIVEGIADRTSGELADEWRTLIDSDLDRFGLSTSWPDASSFDRTVRHESFADFHASLNEVLSLDPSAIW